MSEPALMTVPEVAAMLRISTWSVAAMCRDGRLPRVSGIRRIRIPRAAVLALIEGYYDDRGEPERETSAEAPAPRRRVGRASQGSLAGQAVGSGGAVPRRVGPSEGDVVIRRVESRGR